MPTAHPSRRTVTMVLALAAAAALAGCSNPLSQADVSVSGETTTPAAPADPTAAPTAAPAMPTATAAPAPPVAPTAAATAAPAPATPDATPEATSGTTDAATPAAPTEPLAKAAGNAPFSELRITDLRRGDSLVTLEFELDTVPLSDDFDEAAFNEVKVIQDIFAAATDQFRGENNMEEVAGQEYTRQAVSGTTLVDQVNQKRHLVVRDANNDCLCTYFPEFDVEPNATYRHSVQFAAPPGDVTSMSVQVPSFPAMDDVPLREDDQ